MNDLSSTAGNIVDWLSTLFSNLSTLFHVVTDLAGTRSPFDDGSGDYSNVSDF